MNKLTFKCQRYSLWQAFSAVALSGFLLSPGLLRAMPVVTTVSGGPSQQNHNSNGYVDGDTRLLAQFNTPIGLALDSSGNFLFVADRDNNAIRTLNLSGNLTFTFTTEQISQPVGVAVDTQGNVYALNFADGANGSVVKFDPFGGLLGTIATGLPQANGIALDQSGNVFVTVNGNSVIRITPSGTITTVATIGTAGTFLQGITVLSTGNLAVSDAGRKGILIINPATGVATTLTGFNGTGDRFGTKTFAQFNTPYGIAAAGGGLLVVADFDNNRVKVVDPAGTVTNLYGVASSFWVTGPGTYPGWWDGTVCRGDVNYNAYGCAEARLPAGVTVAPDGSIYTTEDYYHLIRHVTATGLTSPTGPTSGTNVVVTPPSISPNSGYFPMGQRITVTSASPNVYYTTDGTEPTTNSLQVSLNGSIGYINWFNPTNDLTGLRVRAFIGTNASVTVTGLRASINTIGIPSASSGAICAGIGSTIVIPVVANLQTNAQIKSYQFRVEVTPNGGAQAIATDGLQTLAVSTNDFVPLVTSAQGNNTLNLSGSPYTIGSTRGLVISTAGAGNFQFQKFAVVALLHVPIPYNANSGDTYSISVSYPSATSDGGSASVPLTPMSASTIMVTNIPYIVGDSASLFSGWYNAGLFGDGNLANADVNNAFFATLGLRVPYAFSDVYDAMDAFPPDGPGFVGGDTHIRFLDWQLILQRSLRLDSNNWARTWSAGGNRISMGATLSPLDLSDGPAPKPKVFSSWYRQVLLGAVPVGNLLPGNTVNLPIYVKLADGSTLSGMQFRAVLTPQNGAPALTVAPQFNPATGIPAPSMQASIQPGAKAFGWSLGSFNFLSRSSNFLGWISFTMPANAQTGQAYSLSFTNADGSPDLKTQYDFETRSATAVVNAVAPPASICSDEWKLYFFGSLTDPRAADLADPDNDSFVNWMEYLASTDPTDPTSKLRLTGIDKRVVSGQPQIVLRWLTAPGKAYQVQWSSSVRGAAWNNLGTVSGDGNPISYTDTSITGTSRYYRLAILP